MVTTELDIDDLFDPEAPDLYDVLGLDKGATPTEIRRAYRKASMAFHPDRNGGTDEAKKRFQAIKEAYEVLSDVSMREFYDTVGYRRPTDEQMKSKALDLVNQTFTNLIDQMANEGDARFDIRLQEPVAIVQDMLRQTIQQIHEARTNLQRAVSRYEYLQRKFSRKTGEFAESPLGIMLVERLDTCRKRMSLSSLDLAVHEHAVSMASEYVCPAEPQPTMFTTMYTTSTMQY
jgi:curved DNA-binding protein CbpA